MMSNTFQDQKDVNESYKFLVDTTIKVLKLDREEAELRVKGLFRSGILELDPHDIRTQKAIDMFLSIPSSRHKDIPFPKAS